MCGLVGIFTKEKENAATYAVNLLLRLQHRGQDGAGVTVLGPNQNFETCRGLGLVDVALSEWTQLPPSRLALAHTRYATTGTGGVAELQPFVKGSPKLAMAHNGNIVNVAEIVEKFHLIQENPSDLDVLQQIFLRNQDKGFETAVQGIFDEFNGSYSVVGLEQDGVLFGFRDPYGLRPLYFAETPELYALASETTALTVIDPKNFVELQPGEWIRISKEGVQRGMIDSKRNLKKEKRFCMFEVVYFSSPQSEIKEQSIYRLRFNMGVALARLIQRALPVSVRIREKFDYVVPVPETSRAAAIAVAETLGVSYREYLVKNPYVSRTFILNRQEDRIKALKNKLSLIGPEIKGQNILLVDDSVVRGNTSRLMAERLREAGAKTVSLASTCPPIRYGCFYGIDFPDPNELVANNRDLAEIAEALGVDSLYYLDENSLQTAIGTTELCMACLNGKYPTFDSSFKDFLDQRRKDRLGRMVNEEA